MNRSKSLIPVVIALAFQCLVGLTPELRAQDNDPFAASRNHMIRLIEADVRETSRYLKRTELTDAVLRAMGEVPRHEFVPAHLSDRAYQNRPLPIGYGQTISQPYIVAIMSDLLDIKPGYKALEVGTGSGYQAAVLAALEARVWSIEIIEPLGDEARERLHRLGLGQIQLRIGDGYYGWPEQAPFDAIVVTAAASHIPPPLVQQLKVGGKMIIPVGSRFSIQELILITRINADEIVTRQVLPVRFVPLTGGH